MIPKFRAWDIRNKRWMTPEIENEEESEIRLNLWGNVLFRLPWYEQSEGSIVTVYANDVFKIMQYTGLKDKNGAEVYFNDIVEDEYGHRYEVVFEGDCLRCNGIRRIRGGYKPKNRWFDRDLKIIGNIYENSELKEVAE